ncbi:MAG: glycosyltransferase [Actinomycetota bacterium]|nr:glycosyltransferase [Actinomycetota bacterium]
MRVLLATTSNAGHFGPMLPFGAACRRAGHEVLVAAPESFAAAVDRAGYPYWPCADIDPDERAAVHARFLAAEPENRNAVMVTLFADLAVRSIMPGMLSAIDEWRPDVLLREFSEFGSSIAAELRQVPQVQVLIGLDKFVDFTIPLAAPAVAKFRESLGLAPDDAGDRLHRLPSLSLLPLSLEAPRSTVGPQVFRYRDPAAGGSGTALPSWWEGVDTPLVYATFGTVATAVPFALAAFHTVIDSLAELPVRLLATIGDNGDPSDWSALPRNVHVERWLPQQDVFPHAAAMVCHGGTGTVLGALAAGVPLVVVPQFADHPDNAERVAAIGAGLRVGVDGTTTPVDPAEIRAAVTRVLSEPSFRLAANRIAEEIRALPPADDAVGLLEKIAQPSM